MPWVLVPAQPEPAGPAESGNLTDAETAQPAGLLVDPLQAVRDGAANAEPGYCEFIAMGFDALQLALNLQLLSAGYTGIDGATGYLTVDAQGIVRREPAWITFVKGHAQRLPDF